MHVLLLCLSPRKVWDLIVNQPFPHVEGAEPIQCRFGRHLQRHVSETAHSKGRRQRRDTEACVAEERRRIHSRSRGGSGQPSQYRAQSQRTVNSKEPGGNPETIECERTTSAEWTRATGDERSRTTSAEWTRATGDERSRATRDEIPGVGSTARRDTNGRANIARLVVSVLSIAVLTPTVLRIALMLHSLWTSHWPFSHCVLQWGPEDRSKEVHIVPAVPSAAPQ